MLLVIAPRTLRNPTLESIGDLASRGRVEVPETQRASLLRALQMVDGNLEITARDELEIELRPRGRSGASIRLGPVTHEIFVPDWHEGEAGPPVVERALKRAGGDPFVANDCNLTPATPETACGWLLTGPNMAGKSTFLRQNALIAVLAQMGSYVPATKAKIGVVTQLFSRVGASDDLARGRSTFMVEMVETAAILNQAETGALVILDEIGRGTATYDGLSIAWATLEHLHDVNKCRTLFATHYHELTALSSKLEGLSNATVAVREWEGEVIFLHEVLKGAADRSYGVQVARLAGLPDAVVERARIVLDSLEKGEREGGGKARAMLDDLPLFSVPQAPSRARQSDDPLRARLKSVLPDELSPIEALQLLYELRDLSERPE